MFRNLLSSSWNPFRASDFKDNCLFQGYFHPGRKLIFLGGARAGAGALLRLMGRAASHHHQLGSGTPEGHLLESTLLSTPQATPFGDNATKLETNLSPPQALSIPLKIQNPSLKELWGRKENQVEMQPVHRSNLQLGVQVHLLGRDRGAPQRWGQNSHEEPSPSTGRAQQRTRE